MVDAFLSKCHDFAGFEFDRYDENPDLVYKKGNQEVGFESIIIADGQNSADCYFDAPSCTIFVPKDESAREQLARLHKFMHRTLMDHIRLYKLPTILVFTLVGTKLRVGANSLAGSYMLPEFKDFNIQDYYVFDGSKYAKISESSG